MAELSDLYRTCRPQLLRYLRGLLRDEGEAEDVLHEVFLKAFATLQRSPSIVGLPWLYTVARTTATDHLRRRSRHPVGAPEAIVALSDRHRDPSPQRSREWISQPDVSRLVEMLPQRQQEILVLRYVLDCPHAQIARILGCSEESVRKQHQRALHVLARALAGSCVDRSRVRARYDMRELCLPRLVTLGGFSLLRQPSPAGRSGA
jgi:RNA polymerase sigma-70 factor (ECF subfamily)